MAPSIHRFRFFRAGGFDQVLLDRGEDLRALDQLDPKLWVALGCPVEGLEFDEKTLRLIDLDGDGRIRVPEIIAATRWASAVLRDANLLVEGGDTLALEAIDEAHPDGARILASARKLLAELGRQETGTIALADATDTARLYAQMKRNGDGILPPEAADDEESAQAIREILDCVGGEEDRCGKAGVSKAKLDAFFEAAAAFDAWWKKAEAEEATVLPLGKGTEGAVAAMAAVRQKVDDWFTRSRLAAFDPRARAPLGRSEAAYEAVAAQLLSPTGEEVASFPLAQVVPDGALPLEAGLNPAWAERIEAARRLAIEPLLGARTEITVAEWREVTARLEPFVAWSGSNGGAAVAKLGIERVRQLLGSGVRERLAAQIAADAALEGEVTGIALVEKLLRYKRDLYRLLCNFVSFADFYSKKQKAVFQAGTLYLDRRSCDLCVQVADANAHAALAARSQTCLAYCECTRKSDGRKMTIVAAITGGDADDLAVGRNGIFYDRKGADWDARVIKLVENPISVREAFWTPYRKIGQLVGGQIEKFASARDKEVHDKAAAQIAETATKAETSATAPPAPAPEAAAGAKQQAFDVARFAGIFAAIGLAIGAIGSAFAALATGFLQLTWWQMPLAILGVFALISGPSMILAWLKLRGRSLGPILDANGWAVNSRARINIPFGGSLTALATIPAHAQRQLSDPWAEPKHRFATAMVVLLVVVALGAFAWFGGYGEQLMSALAE